MQSLQQLTEVKDRYELAMKAINDGLYDWNLVTNEIYYSPGWLKMLGYQENELPNDISTWEQLISPDDKSRSWNMLQEVLNKTREKFEIEFNMKHKEGYYLDIISRAEVIFDEIGNGISVVGIHYEMPLNKILETKNKEQF